MLCNPKRLKQFDEIVISEVNLVYSTITENISDYQSRDINFLERLNFYEEVTQNLTDLFVKGTYSANESQIKSLGSALEKLLSIQINSSSSTWRQFSYYPAFRCLYASGIAAIKSQKYSSLKCLLFDSKYQDIFDQQSMPLVCVLFPSNVFTGALEYSLSENKNNMRDKITSLWSYMEKSLFPFFSNKLSPNKESFLSSFAYFEYMFLLIYASLPREITEQYKNFRNCYYSAFFGSYIKRKDLNIETEIQAEIQREGANWAPFQLGLFGNSLDNLISAKNEVDVYIHEVRERLETGNFTGGLGFPLKSYY